jgi:hypothetical protein
VVTHTADIHVTGADADTAVGTLGLFQFDTENGNAVKQSVDRTKGAQEAAEGTVDKNAGNNNENKQTEFPGKEGTQHREHIAVCFIGKETACTEQCS